MPIVGGDICFEFRFSVCDDPFAGRGAIRSIRAVYFSVPVFRQWERDTSRHHVCERLIQNQKTSHMEGVKQLTKKEFTEKVADIENARGQWKFLGSRPAVIDFFATWCGPCKALAPVLDELAEDYQYKDRIDFYKIDIDREEQLAAAFGVRSVPTLLFIPLQGPPQMAVGARSKVDLKKLFDNVLLGK